MRDLKRILPRLSLDGSPKAQVVRSYMFTL
jgi:hypothetical protein